MLVLFDFDETIIDRDSTNQLFYETYKDIKKRKAFKKMVDDAADGKVDYHESCLKTFSQFKMTNKQFNDFGKTLISHITKDFKKVIKFLKNNHIKIGILSGGLIPIIEPVASYLGIDKKMIFANTYDKNQVIVDHPLLYVDGKNVIINQLKKKYLKDHIIMIGDGIGDLVTQSNKNVYKFIGFGINRYSKRIKAEAQLYAKSINELIDILKTLN